MSITRRKFLQALGVAPIALSTTESLATSELIPVLTPLTNSVPTEIMYGGAVGGGKVWHKIDNAIKEYWLNTKIPPAYVSIAKSQAELLGNLATLPSKGTQNSFPAPFPANLSALNLVVIDEERQMDEEMWQRLQNWMENREKRSIN